MKNGFTLIELLIVMAIAGIIAFIVVPNLTSGGSAYRHVQEPVQSTRPVMLCVDGYIVRQSDGQPAEPVVHNGEAVRC